MYSAWLRVYRWSASGESRVWDTSVVESFEWEQDFARVSHHCYFRTNSHSYESIKAHSMGTLIALRITNTRR